MSAAETIDIIRDAVWLSVKIGGPVMLVALLVGTAIGLFQALTSVQELTLTFAPKVLAILASLWLLADFMATALINFLHGPLVAAMIDL